jgi:hypothetical protein
VLVPLLLNPPLLPPASLLGGVDDDEPELLNVLVGALQLLFLFDELLVVLTLMLLEVFVP